MSKHLYIPVSDVRPGDRLPAVSRQNVASVTPDDNGITVAFEGTPFTRRYPAPPAGADYLSVVVVRDASSPTLPTQTYGDADTVIEQNPGKFFVLEQDAGLGWGGQETMRLIFDDLAPGEAFTIHAVCDTVDEAMTVINQGCGHNNQSLTPDRLVRCDDCGHEFRPE